MIQIDLEKKLEKNRIRALSPIAFEEYMANLFIKYGYEVEQTPPTNDGGKDLILKYDGVKYYVECKHFTEGTVGREIIQKLVGAGIVDGDVYGFIVATTSCFNDNAIKCKMCIRDRYWLKPYSAGPVSAVWYTNPSPDVIFRW